MHTRREFMELAAGACGTAGGLASLLASIGRAAAIAPAPGSTFLNAEHVVILMQENRSFDHSYGSLRGVRGFNDPRAITLPDGNPVWLQANAAGERYVPFRFDIRSSKVTWMGSLPHGWTDQVDTRNHGLHDRWLPNKQSGYKQYAAMPLTMGYFTRADIPFYYALADAFTICDQYFCSSLTGTTPNRCYLWTGTIRERPTADVFANVRNEEVDLDHLVSWPTFPERLESLGVSWKVYQNELTVDTGLTGEEDAWLANFGDNPLEYFSQFHAHLLPAHRRFVERRIKELPGEIAELRRQAVNVSAAADRLQLDKRIAGLVATLKRLEANRDRYAGQSLDKLSARERALHARAFTTNAMDPAYRRLMDVTYQDGGAERKLHAPKGDVLHQFREDVRTGQLPTVSWLVAPQEFSDHPSSAWYGAWYLAEALNVLTQNPETWRKTIFMLTYDENDGYFDHVPPFVAPHPQRPETGRVTKGIDTSVEFVELEQELKRNRRAYARESPIGLGYRVPLVIASPWSRGGCVCSQVSDHTSIIQFLEKLLSHKHGKKVEETNVSQWRRTVCGDLTASFRPADSDRRDDLTFPPRDVFLESIHQAQFKGLPTGFHALTPDEIESIRRDPAGSLHLPRQEPGVRPSSPLPHQLLLDGTLQPERGQFALRFEVRKDVFGEKTAGAPFIVHALCGTGSVKVRNYAVGAGEKLEDAFPLADFEGRRVHLRAYGPNGFYREFIGSPEDPLVELRLAYAVSAPDGRALTGAVEVVAENLASQGVTIEVQDLAYKNPSITRNVAPRQRVTIAMPTAKSAGWYDVGVRLANVRGYVRRYAGRVETGNWSTSDPAMGRVVVG